MLFLGAIGFGFVVGGVCGYGFAMWERNAYEDGGHFHDGP